MRSQGGSGSMSIRAFSRESRNTKAQSTLESEARAANVEGAFGLARPDPVRSRHIVLIDDLVTTGQTMLACVAALESASTRSISVLAAGRARA